LCEKRRGMCLQCVSVVVAISSLVVKLLKNAGFGSEWDTLYFLVALRKLFIIKRETGYNYTN